VAALTYASGTVSLLTPAQAAIDAGSARSNGNFSRWSLNAIRSQALTQNTSLFVSFAGQKAGKNLDSSEKFILGGANGVRAYPQGEGTGDSGYVASVELRHNLTLKSVPGVWQPFLFADTGEVRVNENPFAITENRRRLSGGGVGLTWSHANDWQVRLALANRIGRQPSVASDTDRHARGWVQVAKRF
jgi:hemolysin activation/secretion protein